MSLDASYKKWDTFKDSSESEDDAAGSGGDEAAPPNAVDEVLSEADLERMAAACRIEDESRAVVETLATTVFAFPGATRPLTRLSPHAVGGYFDSSKGYVELDDLEDGVLGDLRAGFHDNNVDGGIKAHEWRGKEAVALLFYVCRYTMIKRRLIQKVLKWAHRVATSAGGQSISGR